MHALSKNASIRTYQLDLVYLNAALQAGGYGDLAAQVQAALNDLKRQRVELERAEELEMVAAATASAHNATLGGLFKSAAAHVRAHHPEEYEHYFPKAPARVANGAVQEELNATHTLVRQLSELPATDSVRAEFAPALAGAATHLEEAIAQKDEVLQGFAVVRAALDRTRAAINLKRVEIHGVLQSRLKDKMQADRFFRPMTHNHAGAHDTTPTPTTAPATA